MLQVQAFTPSVSYTSQFPLEEAWPPDAHGNRTGALVEKLRIDRLKAPRLPPWELTWQRGPDPSGVIFCRKPSMPMLRPMHEMAKGATPKARTNLQSLETAPRPPPAYRIQATECLECALQASGLVRGEGSSCQQHRWTHAEPWTFCCDHASHVGSHGCLVSGALSTSPLVRQISLERDGLLHLRQDSAGTTPVGCENTAIGSQDLLDCSAFNNPVLHGLGVCSSSGGSQLSHFIPNTCGSRRHVKLRHFENSFKEASSQYTNGTPSHVGHSISCQCTDLCL